MLKRLWVIGLVTLVALVSTALPAHAAGDRAAASRAGAWLVAQLKDGHLAGMDADAEFSNTLMGLLGVLAADDPGLSAGVEAMTTYLKAEAPSRGESASRAAGLAIAAAALGKPASEFGVDPVAAITAETAADGAIGSMPNAYGQGFALVGLERAGATPTEAQVAWLVEQQDASGAFGYIDASSNSFVADPDSTALAVLGLSVSTDDRAKAAADAAATWLAAQQQADGSWAAWSPVNTTALVGSALAARGVDDAKALAWLLTQQDPAGAMLFDGKADEYATSQALLLLGGVSYRTVGASPAENPVPWIVGGGVLLALAVGSGVWLARRR